jgi:hypothetical protein
MKKFLIIILVVPVLMKASSPIYGEYHMQPDKKLHLWAGIIIGGGSYFIGPALEQLIFDKSIIHPVIWSIGVAGMAGAGKEIIYDDWMGRGFPDVKDFYYTVAGGAISGLTLAIIETIFKSTNTNLHVEANLLNKNIAVSYHCSY